VWLRAAEGVDAAEKPQGEAKTPEDHGRVRRFQLARDGLRLLRAHRAAPLVAAVAGDVRGEGTQDDDAARTAAQAQATRSPPPPPQDFVSVLLSPTHARASYGRVIGRVFRHHVPPPPDSAADLLYEQQQQLLLGLVQATPSFQDAHRQRLREWESEAKRERKGVWDPALPGPMDPAAERRAFGEAQALLRSAAARATAGTVADAAAGAPVGAPAPPQVQHRRCFVPPQLPVPQPSQLRGREARHQQAPQRQPAAQSPLHPDSPSPPPAPPYSPVGPRATLLSVHSAWRQQQHHLQQQRQQPALTHRSPGARGAALQAAAAAAAAAAPARAFVPQAGGRMGSRQRAPESPREASQQDEATQCSQDSGD
jgi:hypothetical protein